MKRRTRIIAVVLVLTVPSASFSWWWWPWGDRSQPIRTTKESPIGSEG